MGDRYSGGGSRSGRGEDALLTCYVRLGLQPDATPAEIRGAYRRRVRLLDPDHHAGAAQEVREEARKAMSALERAHAVLSDPQSRQRHNPETGRARRRIPAHYVTLGRAVDATPEEIREAYHRRVRLLHPDRHVGAPRDVREEARKAMTALNRAHDVLSDPLSRRKYDRAAGIYTRVRSAAAASGAAQSFVHRSPSYPEGRSPPPSSRSAYGPTAHHEGPTVSYGPKGPPKARTSTSSSGGRRSRKKRAPSRSAGGSGSAWYNSGGITTVMVGGTIAGMLALAIAILATIAIGL